MSNGVFPNSEDALRETLGLGVDESRSNEEETPRVPAVLEIPEIKSAADFKDNDAADDYIKARNLIHAQLKVVGDMFAESASLAQSTLNPRAFEAFNSTGTLLRTLTQDLLLLQKSFKEIKKGDDKFLPPPPPQSTNTITQNFMATTADVAAMVALANKQMDLDKARTIDAEIVD